MMPEINVDEIETLSFEEESKQILATFDSCDFNVEDDRVTFEGIVDTKVAELAMEAGDFKWRPRCYSSCCNTRKWIL